MSAETLRKAASLMRERAEAATPGPWSTECVGSEGWHVFGPRGLDDRFPQRRPRTAAVTWGSFDSDRADATHIASWHPAVALAVADWLDAMAARAEKKVKHGGNEAAVWSHEHHALAVARTYLGETA